MKKIVTIVSVLLVLGLAGALLYVQFSPDYVVPKQEGWINQMSKSFS
ncbi:hypothetical protein NIE88_19165 [Sporolactobacillus shoreicorticis]|uniref:Uncharacterized protein n=1 Tax=Sporolactobacillus shoreicorticis TaxID=1923877 RepID=A0ABW5S2I7_9BACL|nr:hypothetical protein [Sporolactobacillus shoreicorticis]MCO7127869.1 hypothetical protein [Sporolactobacillus shoreicorticis]